MSDFRLVLERLDKTNERLEVLSDGVTRNAVGLEQHMEQTMILKGELLKVAADIVPLKKGYERAKGAGWLLGILFTALLAARQFGLI